MPTIRDVAADAGVAPSVVSYALSGKKKLPKATVDRIMLSVAKLGYRPDPAARALALGRTNILGFLASVSLDSPDEDVDIFMRFVRGAMYAAKPFGLDVLIMGRGDVELEGDFLADALLVMDIRHVDPRMAVLEERRIPMVLIGVPPEGCRLSGVDFDWAEAGRLMLSELDGLGHRRVAVLGYPLEEPGREYAWTVRFEAALREEAARREIEVVIEPCDAQEHDAEGWVERASDALPGITAVIAINVAALGEVLEAFRRRDVAVPADLSVIAVAPAAEMALKHGGITVVDLPGDLMVRRAVERAAAELEGAEAGAVELLAPRMEQRGSLDRAPGAPRAAAAIA